MFNDFFRLDMESEEIPGFTRLAMDVLKIVIIHDEKAVPDWLRIYISLGGCFLISARCFTTCGTAGFV